MRTPGVNISLYLLHADDGPAVVKTSELSPSTWWVDVGPLTIFCRDEAHASAVAAALNLGLRDLAAELEAERLVASYEVENPID